MNEATEQGGETSGAIVTDSKIPVTTYPVPEENIRTFGNMAASASTGGFWQWDTFFRPYIQAYDPVTRTTYVPCYQSGCRHNDPTCNACFGDLQSLVEYRENYYAMVYTDDETASALVTRPLSGGPLQILASWKPENEDEACRCVLRYVSFGKAYVTANRETYALTEDGQLTTAAQESSLVSVDLQTGEVSTDIAENDQIRVTPVDECLRQAEELYHKWHGRGLLRTAAVPQGRPACTPELMRALKQFARERGLLYHTHLAEGKAETERIRAWTGRGEAEELAHLGVLDESTILAHSIWLTQEEITLLAQSHAVVAHCPSTNMKLSDGAPPIAELLASGARVGFGCDGEASSANRDLLREARLGSYLQKVRTLDPTVLPAGQCYAMLTEQGMRALGYRDVGRIAEGWQADFSLVRTETLCTVNRRRILTNLLYAGSGEQIDSVYVQGRPLLRNGQFVHHDLEHILQRCEEITARIERTLA